MKEKILQEAISPLHLSFVHMHRSTLDAVWNSLSMTMLLLPIWGDIFRII